MHVRSGGSKAVFTHGGFSFILGLAFHATEHSTAVSAAPALATRSPGARYLRLSVLSTVMSHRCHVRPVGAAWKQHRLSGSSALILETYNFSGCAAWLLCLTCNWWHQVGQFNEPVPQKGPRTGTSSRSILKKQKKARCCLTLGTGAVSGAWLGCMMALLWAPCLHVSAPD